MPNSKAGHTGRAQVRTGRGPQTQCMCIHVSVSARAILCREISVHELNSTVHLHLFGTETHYLIAHTQLFETTPV